MGMYDEFDLKVPVQCSNCHTGAFSQFQTKSIGKHLDHFIEGEPACGYGLRDMTKDELIEETRDNLIYDQIYYPVMMDKLKISNFSLHLKKDKSNIVRKLCDGYYQVYAYCHNCNDFMFVNAVVKNGIFIGVEQISEA
jgi:hypothetical protein